MLDALASQGFDHQVLRRRRARVRVNVATPPARASPRGHQRPSSAHGPPNWLESVSASLERVEPLQVVLVACEDQSPSEELPDHLSSLDGLPAEKPLPVREISAQLALDLRGIAPAGGCGTLQLGEGPLELALTFLTGLQRAHDCLNHLSEALHLLGDLSELDLEGHAPSL